MNPQHTIPTLVDNGFVIWDSHAIMSYIVSKYGKDKSLYPEDLEKRAVVDQRLHFDSSILCTRGLMIHVSKLFHSSLCNNICKLLIISCSNSFSVDFLFKPRILSSVHALPFLPIYLRHNWAAKALIKDYTKRTNNLLPVH